jgi:hypothetical protein
VKIKDTVLSSQKQHWKIQQCPFPKHRPKLKCSKYSILITTVITINLHEGQRKYISQLLVSMKYFSAYIF